jgi:hypothetical protein
VIPTPIGPQPGTAIRRDEQRGHDPVRRFVLQRPASPTLPEALVYAGGGRRSPPSATVRIVKRHEIAEAAERTGVSVKELRRLVEMGILKPDAEDRFTPRFARPFTLTPLR